MEGYAADGIREESVTASGDIKPGFVCGAIIVWVSTCEEDPSIAEESFRHEMPVAGELAGDDNELSGFRLEKLDQRVSTGDKNLAGRKPRRAEVPRCVYTEP
jgi:hypothetical protein